MPLVSTQWQPALRKRTRNALLVLHVPRVNSNSARAPQMPTLCARIALHAVMAITRPHLVVEQLLEFVLLAQCARQDNMSSHHARQPVIANAQPVPFAPLEPTESPLVAGKRTQCALHVESARADNSDPLLAQALRTLCAGHAPHAAAEQLKPPHALRRPIVLARPSP